jgi:lipoate-protein ligase A
MELHEVDYKVPDGKLIRLRAEVRDNSIQRIKITGDFFLHPEDGIAELEKRLVGCNLDEEAISSIVGRVLSGTTMVGISSNELTKAIMRLKSI